MYADCYKPLFELAVQLYGLNIFAYYSDLPFEETFKGHQTNIIKEETLLYKNFDKKIKSKIVEDFMELN